MNLQTPTTAALRDSIVASLESSLSQTVPLFPKAFIRVLALVLSGVTILLWRYVGALTLNMFVARASWGEVVVNGQTVKPLVEWGRLIGVGDPRLATAAQLEISLPVEVQTGSLPEGTQFIHPGSSIVYVSTAAVPLDAASITVTVRAASDPRNTQGLGVQGNRAVGDKLSLASPLPNVSREATVTALTMPGTDAETEDAYRKRVIRRFQRRPQGGAYADYQQWGEEAQGIVAVFPYSADTPGIVNLFVEAESTDDNPDGIPTSDQLEDVEGLVNLSSLSTGKATRRPVTAFITAMPIVRTGFGVVVTGLDVPDADSTQAAIESAVSAYLREREPYIVGLSTMPRLDRITQPAISGLVDQIVAADGGTFTSLDLMLSTNAITARTLGSGEKAKLGFIEFN